MPVATSGTLHQQRADPPAVELVEEWFQTYDATRNPAIRERIILAHLGLADRLAARFRRSRGVTHEDLVQSARLALITAVDRYDPSRPNPFIVYAIVSITGELKRSLRDTSWCLHVVRSRKERALQVLRTVDALRMSLGRAPTVAEIAAHQGRDEEWVLEALEAVATRCVLSLDQPVVEDGSVTIGALLPAPAAEIEVEDLLVLPELLDSLPEVERRAVLLRFFGDLTQYEIGEALGYSQMHVSRLLRRAITRMRERLSSWAQ